MADFDYVKARGVAESLINKFGKPSQLVKKGNGGGGYDDFGNPIAPEPDVVINGVVTPLLQYKQHEIDGTRILATDSYVYFHSDELPPIDSQATINSETYIVKNIKQLSSVDDIRVYAKLQVRR